MNCSCCGEEMKIEKEDEASINYECKACELTTTVFKRKFTTNPKVSNLETWLCKALISYCSIRYQLNTDPSEPPEIPEESLVCNICGQKFDTVESLNEHRSSELKDNELKEKGVD